jgi:hypothetical protein
VAGWRWDFTALLHMNDDQWWFLIQAIVHISHQISVVDQKMNILLKNENIDPQLAKLTDELKLGTDNLQAALDKQQPPQVPPGK